MKNKSVPLVIGAVIAVVISVIVFSNNSNPGDILYGVDRVVERVSLSITPNGIAKAEMYLELAEERLTEMDAITNGESVSLVSKAYAQDEQENTEDIETLVEDYEESLDGASAEVDIATEEGEDVEDLLDEISEATLNHQTVLGAVYDRVPDQAKDGILNAMEKSAQGHEMAMSKMQNANREKVQVKLAEKKQVAESLMSEKKAEAQSRKGGSGGSGGVGSANGGGVE